MRARLAAVVGMGSIVATAFACTDEGEDGGAGGTSSTSEMSSSSQGSSSQKSSSVTSSSTGPDATVSAQSSTSSGQAVMCPEPDLFVTYDAGPNGPSESCKDMDAIDPSHYTLEPNAPYADAFTRLAAREMITVSFYFHTAFNSAAGFIVTSHGDGSASVSTWSNCDKAPIEIVSEGAQLAAPAALTACATATEVTEQVQCIRDAFSIDASSPQCVVPGGHVGPP